MQEEVFDKIKGCIDKFFDLITVTDKESGNLLRKQVSRADDEKYEWIEVEEYSPETGKVLFETRYSDGKIFSNLKYLVNEKDMDASTMKCTGRGEYEPIATNTTAEGRAQNRRVEIRIYSILDTE